MKSIVRNPEERKLFALILMFDPEARKTFKALRAMRATDLRLDYMYNRQADGTYMRNLDPQAWNGTVEPYGPICAIRREKEWSVHG